MVAGQAVVQHSPDGNIEKMLVDMEAYATSGEWEMIEELTAALKAAILEVPEKDRRAVLQAAQRSMEKVQTLAQDAKNDLAERLSSIRRGKDATRAYAAAD
jgi:antirestriction protein ArdC